MCSGQRRPLRRGSEGAAVRDLQTRLGLTPDGHFGPRTEAAVRAFQRTAGLAEDGVAGRATREALG
ncbi:peptidoglycan-binding protein [Novosphingopyxis iocasae]|uniref:peptidoglycan-binding protein n=1 Tax=Novosphingopyxis iocasae TaxID=2762729 RepID=UPI0016519747